VCGPSKKYVTYEELVKHKIGNHIYVAPNRSSHKKKKNIYIYIPETQQDTHTDSSLNLKRKKMIGKAITWLARTLSRTRKKRLRQ
jgi:RAB protein geranylgeranyltransferase component A